MNFRVNFEKGAGEFWVPVPVQNSLAREKLRVWGFKKVSQKDKASKFTKRIPDLGATSKKTTRGTDQDEAGTQLGGGYLQSKAGDASIRSNLSPDIQAEAATTRDATSLF